ncbi:MAG: hypothetical protein ACOCNX_00920 [Prevotella sp.]
MKDEQKLKLLRLSVDNASNFDEAKAYASFIMGDRSPIATYTPRTDNSDERTKAVKEGGVYIVTKGLPPIPFGAVGVVHNPEKFDVMVRYHGHEWIVAKEDLKGDKLHLFSDDSHPEDTSSFYKCEIEALNDFDMKSCTEHLRKAGIAFELDADLYIPTAGQLAAMFFFHKELNKALELVGGTPMKEKIYWSSSEISANYSWLVYFNDGYVSNLTNEYNDGYVRPCTAFELKKEII